MNERDAYQWALGEVERRADGDFDQKKLEDLMLGQLDAPDVQELNRKRVRAFINRQKRPGVNLDDITEQLTLNLEGEFSTFPYEADRLIEDGDQHLVELSKAKPLHLAAHVSRQGKNVERVLRRYRHDSELNTRFHAWVMERLRDGFAYREVTFDAFVRTCEIVQPIGSDFLGDDEE